MPFVAEKGIAGRVRVVEGSVGVLNEGDFVDIGGSDEFEFDLAGFSAGLSP